MTERVPWPGWLRRRAAWWNGVRLAPAAFGDAAAPRVLWYAASNVGLGHLMRLVRVARRLRRRLPQVELLFLTDHPSAGPELLGTDVAFVRLPSYRFRPGTFEEEPAGLGIGAAQMQRLRANLILAAAASFAPHAMVMDTAPHGKRNELEPALRRAGRWGGLRILQLRDLPFPEGDAAPGLERLRREGALYDHIFIAGDRKFFDVAERYQLPPALVAKLEYVGFIVPGPDDAAAAPPDPALDALLDAPARRIVAAFGGGWEAATLAPAVIDAWEVLRAERSPLQLLLFTGPAIDAADFARVEQRLKGRGDAYVGRFSVRFPAALARADLAVLQAGSTVYQILDSAVPAILYARDFKVGEQQERARRLAAFNGIRTIDAPWLAEHALAGLMRELLDAPRRARRTGFAFDGAERAAERIASLLTQRKG